MLKTSQVKVKTKKSRIHHFVIAPPLDGYMLTAALWSGLAGLGVRLAGLGGGEVSAGAMQGGAAVAGLICASQTDHPSRRFGVCRAQGSSGYFLRHSCGPQGALGVILGFIWSPLGVLLAPLGSLKLNTPLADLACFVFWSL